jgi:hypothetical protein
MDASELTRFFAHPLKRRSILIPLILLLSTGTLYGGSYGIVKLVIQHNFEARLQEKSDNPLVKSVYIDHLSIINFSDTQLDLNITLALNQSEPLPEISVKISHIQISFRGELFTAIGFPNSSQGQIDFQAPSISAVIQCEILDQLVLSSIANAIMQNGSATLDLTVLFHILGAGAIFPAFSIHADYYLDPQSFGGNILSLDFQSVSLDTEHDLVHILLNASIRNPFDFALNITHISAELGFDDPDGVGLLGRADGIAIASLEFDWAKDPFLIAKISNSSRLLNISEPLPNFFTAARLLDEILSQTLAFRLDSGEIQFQFHDQLISWAFELSSLRAFD